MSSPQQTTTDGPWTVRRVLEWTTGYLKEHGSETPRLDAEVLLAHAKGCPRIHLYTSYDETLPEAVRASMREMVKRRAEAEPVAYLVGHREFFGLDFQVTRDVLIPRPDTETLVVEALEALKPLSSPRVLDIGTGSGCIAVAIAANNPVAQVTAVDASAAALDVARRNVEHHRLADRVRILESDLFAAIANSDPFDLIVSNPPYVADGEMDQLQPDIRLHEPHSALVAGPDGLNVIRSIIEQAPARLRPEGALLLECSPEQAAEIQSLFAACPQYEQIRVIEDLAGRPRVVAARRRNPD
ncbi:MAG: peptide chain release factor N(5)-glutamine methyltransferase [Planctomycetota bacterium]|nr:MAG: peptide chain release factor N(5)-glutamine methyltransferase [Planctomycetota bacterium]